MDELTKQTIEALRAEVRAGDQRLADQIEAQKQTAAVAGAALHERWQANEHAVVVAADVANRRLDNMNEFRGALADQQAHFITKDDFSVHLKMFDEMRQTIAGETMRCLPRTEADSRREANGIRLDQLRVSFEHRLEAEVTPLRAKIEAAHQPNWGLIISILSVLMVMGTGLWMVIGLQVSNAIEPVKLTAEQTKLALSTEAARTTQIENVSHGYTSAVADIEALKRQAGENTERVSSLRADATRQSAALIEIETQFCAADIMRNLTHAQDMRLTAMLWARSFDGGMTLPTDNAYYPVICNRPGAVMPNQTSGR